ncbi:MAG: hypothetical protein DMG98_15725 [Acidobacteria bacterium]|nr:MAG: hypothetical protein DMG98_15725 [Acidobacteriota bacterium]
MELTLKSLRSESLCENASYAPFGAESFPTCTQGFRPGLYSSAASRLGITIRLPPVVRSLSSHSDCEGRFHGAARICELRRSLQNRALMQAARSKNVSLGHIK